MFQILQTLTVDKICNKWQYKHYSNTQH